MSPDAESKRLRRQTKRFWIGGEEGRSESRSSVFKKTRWGRSGGKRDEKGGEAQFLWSVAQVLLWQPEPARQPVTLSHLILCFSFIPPCSSLSFARLSIPLHSSGSLSSLHFSSFHPSSFISSKLLAFTYLLASFFFFYSHRSTLLQSSFKDC